MTRIERKLLMQTAIFGVGLTLLVVVADQIGLLAPIERWFYDRRAKDCQFFTPPPTDKLVHVDITDASLQTIGHWPWPHAELAAILKEISDDGAKYIALDVVFPEPSSPRATSRPDGSLKEWIDDDAIMADTIRKMGNVITSASFDIDHPTAGEQTMFDLLYNDPSLTLSDVRTKLDDKALRTLPRDLGFETVFDRVRNEAMFRRIAAEMRKEPRSYEVLRAMLLPRVAEFEESVETRHLAQEYERVMATRAMDKSSRPLLDTMPPLLPVKITLPPVTPLSKASAGVAFVNDYVDADGVVRCMPMCVGDHGIVYPHLSLLLALKMLDVPFEKVKIEPDRIVIPLPNGAQRAVPTYTRKIANAEGQRGGTIVEIPWFGPSGREWEVMYDFPNYSTSKQHLPIVRVWNVLQQQKRLEINLRTLQRTLIDMLYLTSNPNVEVGITTVDDTPDEMMRRLRGFWSDAEFIHDGLRDAPNKNELEAQTFFMLDKTMALLAPNVADRDKLMRELIAGLPAFRAMLDKQVTHSQSDTNRRDQIAHVLDAMVSANAQTSAIRNQTTEDRKSLHEQFAGRAVIIGSTAIGATDFVPTSLHATCPGAVVHGVLFSALMTGDVWYTAPVWITMALTLIFGLFSTTAISFLPPVRASIAIGLIAVAYWIINGIVLFDWGNVIVGMAGPTTAIGLVWGGCILFRFVVERAERTRITRRFSSYADPSLVNYIIENPEKAAFDGQERELTVVFTDMQGFTSLSERLGPKIVTILNEYFSLMVPLIKEERGDRHGGYVNKFMGDGIMFFFGAPYDNAMHAADAVATVLRMQEVIPKFNETLAARGLPPVKVRAGVATGRVTVGDAGADTRSDYTVLGDEVNLSSRLESANKQTGTLIMINERAAELIGSDLFLMRPIGKIVVVGKTEPVMVYEPLAFQSEATDVHKTLAKLTRDMVDAYVAGEFEKCRTAIAELEKVTGHTKLTAIYERLCEQYIKDGPPADFQGQIVLTEK